MIHSRYSKTINTLAQTGSLRSLKPLEERKGCYTTFNGVQMLNMTSNDYLGISGDQEILDEFYSNSDSAQCLEKYGLGAASSRLLTGDCPSSHKLERMIAETYGKSSCLLFNSGYHANIGILPALTGKNDLILSDKLNHASIHDGMRLSLAQVKRFRHGDYHHLQSLLEEYRSHYDTVIIVTESVFSMDGDVADLRELVAIKKHYDCLLYLDEAHGVGVYGEKGLGKAEEYQVVSEIDLLVGTFGKAYSSIGAFLVCDESIYDYLVNFSRSLIFTTALPPVVINWNLFIYEKVLGMSERRKNLQSISMKFREEIICQSLKTDGETNIIPVIIGDNLMTVQLAENMQKHGYLIYAIRPPTVPKGTSRFRLSLCATMNWDELQEIPRLIRQGIRSYEE